MRRRMQIGLLTLAGAIGAAAVPTASWRAIAWNNLGMHCMDAEYSVYSILPPYNTLQVQVVDPSGNLIVDPAGVTVTYEAVADPAGSINATSVGKTDFWEHVLALFGASLPEDAGLAGNAMPGAANVPQPMTFEAARSVFAAEGIPITPYDDAAREEPLSDDAGRRPRLGRRAPDEHERRPSRVGRNGLPHLPRLGNRDGRPARRGLGERLRHGPRLQAQRPAVAR